MSDRPTKVCVERKEISLSSQRVIPQLPSLCSLSFWPRIQGRRKTRWMKNRRLTTGTKSCSRNETCPNGASPCQTASRRHPPCATLIHSFWTIELAAEKGRARERERGADPQIRQIASINEIEKRIDPLSGRTDERGRERDRDEISGFHRSL